MRARDLAVKLPLVRLDDPVAKAVRVMADEGLPGLVIVDHKDIPRFVLRGTQVLRLLVSQYSDDPALARTVDEASADLFWSDVGVRSIDDCLAPAEAKRATVPSDATVLEVAITMSRLRSPIVAVVNEEGRINGCITLNRLLTATELPEP